MTHKQNDRNKNKEQKHTLLLIMGREKIDQNNKQCFYLQKIKLKKKRERERERKNP